MCEDNGYGCDMVETGYGDDGGDVMMGVVVVVVVVAVVHEMITMNGHGVVRHWWQGACLEVMVVLRLSW